MPVISIDLWGTLIKSSPQFSEAKILLTKKYFNVSGEFITECYQSVKKQFNDIIEITGMQPVSVSIFKLLFYRLGGVGSDEELLRFIYSYQDIAIKFPPLLYSDETKEYLAKLSEHGNLILSSNTMLISGHSLQHIMNGLGILKYFQKTNFSDQLGVAKPSKEMYSGSHYHIGDNPLTDGRGAKLAGSIPVIINSSKKTIKDAYNFIIQREGV